MNNYVIHKNEVTSEGNFLFFSGTIAVILAIKTEKFIAFAPIIVLISIALLCKILLLIKWSYSYALKMDQTHIVLNHTIWYNKVSVPLSAICCLNREKKYAELKEDSGIRLSIFGLKTARIDFSTLTDIERKEIFDRMENFGIRSV